MCLEEKMLYDLCEIKYCLFFIQISSTGSDLKIMACDQKIIKVALGEPVGYAKIDYMRIRRRRTC